MVDALVFGVQSIIALVVTGLAAMVWNVQLVQ